MQNLELLNADCFLYNTTNEERIITGKKQANKQTNEKQGEEAGKS